MYLEILHISAHHFMMSLSMIASLSTLNLSPMHICALCSGAFLTLLSFMTFPWSECSNPPNASQGLCGKIVRCMKTVLLYL